MHNPLLKRPKDRKMFTTEGSYKGYIEDAAVKIINSAFTDTGKKEVLAFTVVVENENSEEVELLYFNNLTWSKYGNLHKTLVELDRLPNEGEKLDLDSVKGIEVKVEVKNNEKDGITYSNIVSLKKISDQEYQKPKGISMEEINEILGEDE